MPTSHPNKSGYPSGALTAAVADDLRPIPIPPGGPEQPLTAWLRAAGLALNTRCAEHGRCSGCLVELLEGALLDTTTNQIVEVHSAAPRLRACQHRLPLHGRATIRIPPASLLAGRPQIVSRFAHRTPYELRPLYRTVRLRREDLRAAQPGAAGIEDLIAARLGLSGVRIADTMRSWADDAEGNLDAVVERFPDGWVVTAVAPEAPGRALGAALDIGTTTVVLCIVDLATGQILAEASAFNAQLPFGEDVLTRIELCSRTPDMLSRLQHAVVDENLVPLLHEACAAACVPTRDVRCLTVVGNTTMLHLFAGVDPTSIGVSPFTPAFLEHRVERRPSPRPARSAARQAPDHAPAVHLLPGASGYLGADVVAGVVATGLAHDDGPSLLIDLGTNGEIVLKHDGELLGCATAAGPAFEGVGLRCGIRAMHGAISHVAIAEQTFLPQLRVIGDEPPVGLCGSAYVDFLAEARRIGLLNPRGRLAVPPRPGGEIGPVALPDGARGVALVAGHDGRSIVVTEADVAKLLPAKAAIAAGVQTLLEIAALAPDRIVRLYLAGGFGLHLNVAAAIACGLLPGFTTEQVVPVGNSALGGAYLALLDAELLAAMDDIRRRIRIVELNRAPGFESRFIHNMRLP